MKSVLFILIALAAQVSWADGQNGQGILYLKALKAGALGDQSEINMTTTTQGEAYIDPDAHSIDLNIFDTDDVFARKGYRFTFIAAQSEKIKVQSYDHVKPFIKSNPLFASIDMDNACEDAEFRFQILELETKKTKAPDTDATPDPDAGPAQPQPDVLVVSKAAANFVESCGGVPTIAGAIRFNSAVPIAKPPVVAAAPVTAQPSVVGTITMKSDEGDYIGQGQSYTLKSSDGLMQVSNDGGAIAIAYDDGNNWTFTFKPVGGLKVGKFKNAKRWPFNEDTENGISVDGPGRGCNQYDGEFEIKELVTSIDQSTVTKLSLDFTQHCDGAGPAVRGSIQFKSGN